MRMMLEKCTRMRARMWGPNLRSEKCSAERKMNFGVCALILCSGFGDGMLFEQNCSSGQVSG